MALSLVVLATVMVANPASAAATYTFYASGSAVGQSAPGVAKDYTLNLTNLNSTAAISFNLSVVASPQGWTASLSASSTTVGPSATRQIILSVTPPSSALADAVGQYVNVTATPDDNTAAQTVSTTTRVTEFLGVSLSLIPQAGTSADPGQNLTWLAHLKNTGNSQQTYTVTVNNTSYTSTNLTTNLVTVSPGDTYVILVTINVSATAPVGTLYSRILATSNANTSIEDSVLFSASINAKRAVALSGLTPDDLVAPMEPESSFTFRNVIVENRGNVVDTYLLQGSANASRHGDWVSFDSGTITISAFTQRYLNVTVTVPPSLSGTGTYMVEFRIISENSTAVIAFLNLTVELQLKHDLAMAYGSLQPTQTAEPGGSVSFPINVSNPGVFEQRVDISYAGPNPSWVTISASPFTLSPGAFKIIFANFTVPGAGAPGLYNFSVKGTINWTNPYRNRTVDLALEVRQVYGVIASSTASANAGSPGADVAFPIKVLNSGTGLDNFTVSVTNSTQVGSLSLSSATLAIAGGASQNVTVTISIASSPLPAAGLYYFDVTVTSSGNVSRTSTVTLALTVDQVFAISTSVTPAYQAGNPGSPISFTLSVANDGNGQDTVTLQRSGANQTWLSFPTGSGSIARGAAMDFTVQVTAPSWSAPGDTVLGVRAVSGGEANVSDGVSFTVSLNALYLVALSPATQEVVNAHRNSAYAVSVTLRNSGNQPDTYTLSLTGADANWATLPSTSYTLASNENLSFVVTIDTPAQPSNGGHLFNVRAVSLGNASVVAMAGVTVTINDVFDPEVQLARSSFFALPGGSVAIAFTLQNNGTLSDTLQLTAVARFPAAQYYNLTTALLSPGATAGGTFTVVADYPFSGDYAVEFRVVSLTSPGAAGAATATISLEVIRTVDVTAAADTTQGGPDDLFNYSLSVRNLGNITDTYTLSFTPPSAGWAVSFSQSTFTLVPDGSADVMVFVQAPSSLAGGTYNTLVAAVSQNASSARDTVTLRVTVTFVVNLQPTATTAQLSPGESHTFDLVVLNDGSARDQYALSPTGQVATWVNIVPSTVTIAGGTSAVVQVTVMAPLTEHEGTFSFAVRAASLSSSAQSPAQAFAVTVNQRFAFSVAGPTDPLPVAPGKSGNFVLTLTNTGNGNDSYSFVAAPSQSVAFDPPTVTLDALETINVSVIFSPPSGATAGTQALRVTVFGGAGSSADVFLNATVLPAYNITARGLPAGDLSAVGDPGATLTVTFEVANHGNTLDTANWTLVGNASGWASVRSGSSVLTAGNSVSVTLEFTVPSDPTVGLAGPQSFQVLVQSQGGGAASLRILNGTLTVSERPSITFSLAPTVVAMNTSVTVDRETAGVLEFPVYIRNLGNREEVVTLARSPIPGWTIVLNVSGGGSSIRLQPGAVGTANVRVTPAPGAVGGELVKVTATVADRKIPSLDVTIEIIFETGEPGIVSSSVSVSPTAVDAGRTVQVTFTVRNTGDGTATNVQVELLVNGAQADQTTIAVMAPGASREVTLQWTPSQSSPGGVNQLAVGIVGAGSSPASEVRVTTVEKSLVQRITGDNLVLGMLGLGLVLGLVIGLVARRGRKGAGAPASQAYTEEGAPAAPEDALAGLAALEAEGAGPAAEAPAPAQPGVEHKVVCPNCNTEQWITGSEGECKNCGVIIEVAADDAPSPEGSA
jgi:uncharacterized membrane protein